MKRITLLLLLVAAGIAVGANSAPGYIASNGDNQLLTIYCWEGTATYVWQRFEIYYHAETGNMWGTWYRGEDEGGWIDGFGVPDPTAPAADWIAGSGSFGGDAQGNWEGTFILNRRCWGTVWNMMGIGSFEGRACP